MNKFHITLIIILVLSILSIYFINLQKGNKNDNLNEVCFKSTCFQVEIADNSQLRQQGLMYRTQLDADKGMFFIFDEEGIYPFWMKNTLIPLDIIWINENKEVVYIENKAQPCKQDICKSYNPNKEAKYVLEINAGLSDKIGLKINSKLELK